MLRLDPSTGTFTSVHLQFIQLCMETRSYAAAVPILDNYIHSLPSVTPTIIREGLEYSVPCADTTLSGEFIYVKSGHSGKVTASDVMEYYVLGAMAYLGVRQFKHAHAMLEHALVMPTAGVANGLMVEAYKKWVLLSCLVNRSVSSTTHRACRIAITHKTS
jgi:COP9 signalosome complex subunit 3